MLLRSQRRSDVGFSRCTTYGGEGAGPWWPEDFPLGCLELTFPFLSEDYQFVLHYAPEPVLSVIQIRWKRVK